MEHYVETGSKPSSTPTISLFTGLAALVGLLAAGCAAGPRSNGVRVAQVAAPLSDAPSALFGKRSPKPGDAQESTSPQAEGAAFLVTNVLAAATKGNSDDDRTSALLSETARCPAEMSLVNGTVCVDRWEGALVQTLSGGRERLWSPYLPIDGHEGEVRAVSRPGVIPQAYISGKQAETACRASGKRLCSSDEWQTACRGPDNTTFPYGNERRAGVCNDDFRGLHPVPEAAALLGIPSKSLWSQGMNQSIINQLSDTLLPTGERAECTNGYGVFDMVGNLHEWVGEAEGTFRGGYYMDTSKNGDGCSYATKAHDFTYHDYSTGFRCCADPESVE
ncbi:MAG: SUMF1/EgtB/PvdO family nonheme iron enzyme [Byssovorax sp.]